MGTEQKWKLGVDIFRQDNLLDGITFDDLILAVHCNCRTICPTAVRSELRKILEQRQEDMVYLLENNMDCIMEEAQHGRE